jgi:hypothetical protein
VSTSGTSPAPFELQADVVAAIASLFRNTLGKRA